MENKSLSQSYLNELNDIQRKAVVTIKGPVLVVAGPGSGKTRVLTYRIANIIESGVAPWEILSLTFTNKAAKEMKERIAKVVGDRAHKVWAGTFHSVFAKILRVEAQHIGYSPNFTIYDTDDSKSVLTKIISGMNLNKDKYKANIIKNRISSAKSNIISPVGYRQQKSLLEQDSIAGRPKTVDVYEKYMAKCKASDAMDFDDLLYQLFYLFYKFPEIAKKYQAKFKYILVDEFQDTNHLQYSIMRKLVNYGDSERNICVVGDDAQSIYGFRGATIDNILDFEKDFKPHGIQTFKLEQNYRSTEHIVQAANEVISYNSKQIQKKIWSHKGSGNKINILKVASDNEEGSRIVHQILEQKNRDHLSNSDIAILYRTNGQSRIFEEYLRRYNVPYRIFGGLSFYQRKEVKDALAYLRIAINPNDEEALLRSMNYPKRGIGDTTLTKIRSHATENSVTLRAALKTVDLPARVKAQVRRFEKLLTLHEELAQKQDAYESSHTIIKNSGIIELLKKDTTPEGQARIDNLGSLLDGIKDFVENDEFSELTENSDDRSLTNYLQNIALVSEQDKSDESSDVVTLMSVHAAKGLEFPSVFVVGLEENLFPSFMALESQNIDEERRLFYVAITRAEKLLTLSFANSRYQYGNLRHNSPSRFLEEIDANHYDNPSVIKKQYGGTGTLDKSDEPRRAALTGISKSKRSLPKVEVDMANFKPSPSDSLEEGMKVLHLKFGKGKILSIEGGKGNRIASIQFESLGDEKKRIMLKFAKLQILND